MYSYPVGKIAVKGEEDGVFKYYSGKIVPENNLPIARTVYEAISDLPPIYTDRETSNEVRDFTKPRKYRNKVITKYQNLMRTWKYYEANNLVEDHVTRYLKRDHAIFKKMKQGAQYPEAHAIAEKLFWEKIEELGKNGKLLKPGTKDFNEIMKATVPPYATDKFPNKWQKLDPGMPSHTITAHLGKDTYSHIHYDSRQARVISVREAARLQSFPDGFKFPKAMSHAFRQIGNSVPPLLAYELAESIKKQIK